MSVWFITGGTGFIGKELIRQSASGGDRLLLLVRSKERAGAALRRWGIEEGVDIRLLQGDLTAPGLGLQLSDRELARTADVIIHAGGTMSVTLDPLSAKRTFLEGARHLSELAAEIQRTKGLQHFIHIVGYMSPFDDGSTGMDIDVFQWDEFMAGEGSYERMKFLSDLYIRQQAAKEGYPLSVVNPCSLVGPRPAATTEQTGGLGLLVDAVRRRCMPVIPGGASHWLPLGTVDDLARIIVDLARDKMPQSRTYNVLGTKEEEPDMKELLILISRELRIPAPHLSVPVQWLRGLMRAGGSRLTGIPLESLSFVTDRSFRTAETAARLKKMGAAPLKVRDILPMAVADLDYRLTYPGRTEPLGWVKERKGELAVLVKEGSGTPWVLIHGMLSGADDFVPLAEHVHAADGRPVWIVDLPGFGRSPSLKAAHTLQGTVDALCRALAAHSGPIRLAGHSFGAVLAARAAAAMSQRVRQLFLLQPVLHVPRGRLRRWISASPPLSRFLLQRLSASALRRMLLQEEGIERYEEIPDGYVESVIRGLSSPRIAAANADMLRLVQHALPNMAPAALPDVPIALLWGERDRMYSLPEAFRGDGRVFRVPYGHQFPVFYPEAAARLLIQLKEERADNGISMPTRDASAISVL
ncbi:alpha/beta fold hydrolase [Paenibacillus dendritiformis]|uniref:alpha/beta fold hydrolase n=1 Tax=Paenibacillus dendritiformis TaxID=130049 RepID=UPI00387E0F5B